MFSNSRRLAAAVSVLFILIFSAEALQAQSDRGLAARQFGLGQPQRVQDLPPGQLKRRLETLPPQASANALRWLQDISFTGTDLEVLKVDDEGGVFFADTLLPDPELAQESESLAEAEAATGIALDEVFNLHSRPGAPNTVFLDFDGHVISGTAWNASGASVYYAAPYDLDGDPLSFNDTERARIAEIWHRVAEDLAPFDINVTTEEPASFDRYTGRILITHSKDETGVNMPYSSAGGVAYVNVFGANNYHTYYSPALVYYNNLSSGSQVYVAEASSHEFGHNLGLSHDGTISGTTYYSGHGSGLVSWAPIMGNSYHRNVTQWSKGEYPDANQTQDDLAIIGSKLGYVPDDHGNTIGTGTALVVDADGTVISSNPELDPHNLLRDNKGVINSIADVDVFSFIAGSGQVELTVAPAWDAFYGGTSRRGANLDIHAELRDAAGDLLASGYSTSDTMATVSVTVTAGTYHLLISGAGNQAVPYSEYASLGQYFINGSVPAATADTTPPTPNPMTWASAPSALGETAIAMTATTAQDETSAVQYRFNCVSGGTGCVNSDWQSSTSYTVSGLVADTQYTFTVIARDASGNQTAASTPASATTVSPPAPPAYTEYFAAGEESVSGSVNGNYTDTHADDGIVQAITEIESGGKPSNRYSYLEHRWTFNVGSGSETTVHANAWSGGSRDGDTFDFEYSLDGGSSWHFMFNIASTASSNRVSFRMPGSPDGTVLLRVIDTNRAAGSRFRDTVYVDQLSIQVASTSGEAPDGAPSDLTATAVSASRIDLSWTDNASNETSYRVERSVDGGSWALIAELPADSQSFADSDLQSNKTLYYRVSAYNPNGSSGYAQATATTHDSLQHTSLGLSAKGYKARGFHRIDLAWDGSGTVDVYRNGSLIAEGVEGEVFGDHTDSKGSGSYEHQVCLTGSASECSNVTTTAF
jgi:hypothetical protein